MITLTLPIPPSVNGLWVRTNGGVSKSVQYNAWLQEAGWRINEQRKGQKWLPGGVWYWTDIRLPHSHLGDSDNRIKAVHDLLHSMGVTPDDKWLLGGTYMRCHSVDPGTIVVSVKPVPGGQMNDWEQIRLIAEQMITSAPKTVGAAR